MKAVIVYQSMYGNTRQIAEAIADGCRLAGEATTVRAAECEPAERLLVVEVVTPSGHSSSYPPHKHDTDNVPLESSLEEAHPISSTSPR